MQILAQARQWTLVEKAGQIIRTVGQEFAAPDADEEIEKLARDLFGPRIAGGLRQCGLNLLFFVMAGLGPAMTKTKAWMPGSRPGMAV